MRTRVSEEQMAKINRFRMIGVALLVVSAFGAVLASVAQAETAPYFTIGGTRLVAGRTHNFDARVAPIADGTFTLTNSLGTNKISCTAFGTEEGVLLGSNAGAPGKDNEIVVFSGCAAELPAGCKLTNAAGEPTSVIVTEALKSEQVENVESSKVGKRLDEEIFPSNPANGFATIHLTGGETCVETRVSGQVVGEVLLDNSSLGNIELGQAPQERTSWLLKFPNPPITQVWLISGTGGKIQKTAVTVFGEKSILVGTSLQLLASTKCVPEPNALWSPLP